MRLCSVQELPNETLQVQCGFSESDRVEGHGATGAQAGGAGGGGGESGGRACVGALKSYDMV